MSVGIPVIHSLAYYNRLLKKDHVLKVFLPATRSRMICYMTRLFLFLSLSHSEVVTLIHSIKVY